MFPRLITLGPVTLHSYGVLVALGLLAGLWLAARLGNRAGLPREQVWNLGVYMALTGILGAKALLIATEWDYYSERPGEIFSLASFQAGGVFYGGLLSALALAFLYARRQKLGFALLADVYSPGVSLGHIFGRVGCFLAGCCWGKPTELPWGVTFSDPYSARVVGVPLDVPLHPTQLYEAAAEIMILSCLLWLGRRQQFHGQVFAAYIFLYGSARFVLEFYRGDPRATLFDAALTAPQALSLALMAAGAGFWLWQRRRGTLADGRPAA